jgi:cobaltochelatase CobS
MEMVYVGSANRNAARKLLVAAGHPAADVRDWPLAKLGAVLREQFKTLDDAGKTALNHALMAGVEPKAEAVEPKPKAQPSGLGAAIIAELEAAGYKPNGVDVETLREMVGEAVEAAQIRPSVIEVRGPAASVTIEGRQHPVFETVCKLIAARCDLWLVGPAGSGKSTVAINAAKALGMSVYMTGAIMSKYDLIGFRSPNGDEATLRTPFRDAFEHGGVFILDDTDRSDAKALAAFNGAIANRRYAFPDREVEAHPDFVIVATANTWGTGASAEYVGAGRMDAATLDRFVQIEVGYDEQLERDIAGAEYADWCRFVQRVRKACGELGIKRIVSPRATIKGAKALGAGLPRDQVERLVLFGGLDRETEARIRSAA